jgi:riboflavin transporter FmnP
MDSPAAKGLLIAGVFLLTSLASRLVVKRHPVEASDPQRKRVAVGIIDFTWCSILAGALGILVFFTCTPLLADISPSGPLPLEFVQAELSSTMFLLEKTIDSVFLLGGILAGCMGILWAGEIWRKSDSQSRRKYRSTTVAAIRMTIAYFVTIINILYWVAIPLYIRLGNLSALLKK